MPLAIGDVVELIRPDRAARFGFRKRFREAAGVADVIVGIGIGNRGDLDQFGAGEAQHVLLFLRLGVRDDDDGTIAKRARHHRDADPGIAGGALDNDPARPERPRATASLMIASAARSLTEPPGFMNSALPRIVHPVSSEAARSLMSGVRPIAPMTSR